MASISGTGVNVTVTADGLVASTAFDGVRATACLASNATDCKAATCPKADAAAGVCAVAPLTTGAAYDLTAVLLKAGVVVSRTSEAKPATPLHP